MQEIIPFDWTRIWMGEEAPATFLLEIAFRSFVMYLLILITLRITGKRGIKQLSMFEFSIILALGSAAGDPMFYNDVPLAHALVVFAVIIALYVFFNYLTEKNERIEKWFQGSSACVIDNGKINLQALKNQKLTYMELFGEIRQQQVEHLGQVRKGYLEPTGEISLFFFEAEAVQPGLPIFPEILASAHQIIVVAGWYACKSCGHVQKLNPSPENNCPECHHHLWLKACTAKRVS